MTTDFSKPQRQSAFGILIMAAVSAQRVLKALIAPIIIAIVKADKEYVFYFGIPILVVLVGLLVFSYLSYRRFTFYLDEERQEFIVNKGILNRTQITVQLDKIQQVNIDQNLLQKIVGIYGLKIDTAGSDGKEVSIKAIDKVVADRLREQLLERRNVTNREETPSVEQSALPAAVPFFRIRLSTLLKVGLTSNYGGSIAVIIAFLIPLFQHTKEILSAFSLDDGRLEKLFESILTFFSIAVFALILVFLLLIINVIRTFVRYFDFEIAKYKHSLLISAGLFAKKNTLLSPNKVQITSYSQNFFQRKMNLLNVSLKQTEVDHQDDGEEVHHSNLEVPGCNRAERDQLLSMILGNLPEQGAVFKPNIRFLNLPIIFKAVLPFLIFLCFWSFIPDLKPFFPIAIFYVVLVTILIYISYKKHQITVTRDFIIKRRGIWDIEHGILRPHKIQAISTFQYPWHKSVNVGHVDLHTAAGVIHFKFGNYTEIKQLVNYWLYQVESSTEDWM